MRNCMLLGNQRNMKMGSTGFPSNHGRLASDEFPKAGLASDPLLTSLTFCGSSRNPTTKSLGLGRYSPVLVGRKLACPFDRCLPAVAGVVHVYSLDVALAAARDPFWRVFLCVFQNNISAPKPKLMWKWRPCSDHKKISGPPLFQGQHEAPATSL